MTPEQFEERRGGIGGSEIAAILGLDAFSGPLDVWLAKVEGYQRPVNDDMLRGLCLEAGIADWYGRQHQVALDTCARLAHATAPHAFATPDRLAWGGGSSASSPSRRLAELATHGARRAALTCRSAMCCSSSGSTRWCRRIGRSTR
jgi:hypothetical protein